jgi:hypothetical protein
MIGEYKKREVVIEVNSKADFNTNVCLVAWNDKADGLDEFETGMSVTVSFRPKSIKSKKGSWFSNLNLVSINETKIVEKVDGHSSDEDCPF